MRVGVACIAALLLQPHTPIPQHVEGRVVFDEFTESPRGDPHYELLIEIKRGDVLQYNVLGNGQELTRLERYFGNDDVLWIIGSASPRMEIVPEQLYLAWKYDGS